MNQILEDVKKATLAKAKPELVPVINKVVESGKLVMFDEKTREMSMAAFAQADSPESIGAAVAKLAGILFNQSKHTIPMPALIPAATILMCEALQFMEDAGAVEVDNEFMSECTKALGSNILQLLKITPERLQSMIDKSGGQGMPAAPAPQSIVSGAQGEEQ